MPDWPASSAIRAVLGEAERPRASDLHRLVETQLVDPDALAAFLSDFFRLRLIDRTVVNASRATAQKLSLRFLMDNWVMPLTTDDGELLIGVLHPGDREPIDALLSVMDEKAEVCVVSAPDLEACLQRLYGATDAG